MSSAAQAKRLAGAPSRLLARALPALALALEACTSSGAPEYTPAAAASGAPPPAAELSLELRLARDLSAVDVAFAFQGDADGETELALSEPIGRAPDEQSPLEELRVEGGDGEAVPLTVLGPYRWQARHAPGERLVVRARLPRNREPLRASFTDQSYLLPILEPDLLHAIGRLFVPFPQHIEEARSRALEVSYRGFLEAGWAVCDSFGTGPGPRRARASLLELGDALFLAGKLDLYRPEETPGLVVAVARHDFDFYGVELAALAARILSLERELMADPSERHYLVSAIAVGRRGLAGPGFAGNGLLHAFALYLQPGASLALEGEQGLELRRLLAHEGFHEWNGRQIRVARSELLCDWFTEGFTDYFARRVLRRSGWLPDPWYAWDLSNLLALYHTSTVRNRTAAELAPVFWAHPVTQQQPYLRGDVVACLLEHALLQASAGERDLADFMRDLLREGRSGQELDLELLLARIAEQCGAPVAERIRRCAVDGETAELPAGAFGPGFELRERTILTFDPGFDFYGSLEEHAALGVSAAGPAAQAGLVEGQAIHEISIARGDREWEFELGVKADLKARTLAFVVRGEPVVVPCVRVAGSPPEEAP